MMTLQFSMLIGLASAQVFLYRVDSRQAFKTFWFLGLFYFFLLSFVQGLRIFCGLFLDSFYEVPILLFVLFILFRNDWKGFPTFKKAFRRVPAFYLFSSLWVGLAWVGPFSSGNLVDGFFWSFFAAFMIPILAGIKERLELSDSPTVFNGLPLFLISTGILLLAFLFF